MPDTGDHGSDGAAPPVSARCSFCLESEGHACNLFAGLSSAEAETGYICDECAQLFAFLLAEEKPIDEATRQLLAEKIDQRLESLPDRDREIIKLRLGATDGYRHTLDEVSRRFELTVKCVVEIERRAMMLVQSQNRSER
jgi:DNA-directed RNA polymerase sigma subunit (sigma70/sigma32)